MAPQSDSKKAGGLCDSLDIYAHTEDRRWDGSEKDIAQKQEGKDKRPDGVRDKATKQTEAWYMLER